MSNEHPLLAFVHIPRTGGGTVSSAISKNYSRIKSIGNFQRGPEKTRTQVARLGSDLRSVKAVGDHVPYGLLRRHLPDDTRYLTFLREPVDRVLSHYHFHAQAGNPPGSRGHHKLRSMWEMLLTNARDGERVQLEPEAEFSLEEGLRRKIPVYDNFMTRFLWGGETIFGELPADALERAKENIAGFWFVGISERLDDSIILLGRQLGIGLMPYFRRHVSWRRPPLADTPDELRELVAEYNAMDVELYRFARERFDEEAPPPDELAGEAEELRRLSIEVTEQGEARRAARKQAGRAARAEASSPRKRRRRTRSEAE